MTATNSNTPSKYPIAIFFVKIAKMIFKGLFIVLKNILWVLVSMLEIIAKKLLEIFQKLKTKL